MLPTPMMIDVRELTKTYLVDHTPLRPAIDQLSLCVPDGQVLGVLGLTGAGKTTLLRLLAGIDTPSLGAVHIAGHDTITARDSASHQIGCAIAPIQPQPASQLVWDVMTDAANGPPPVAAYAEQLLRALHAWELRSLPFATIALAQQRMVGVLRALATQAPILLLDQPTHGLDGDTAQLLEAQISTHISRFRPTVVLASDQPNILRRMCDRLIVLYQGRLLADLAIADLASLLDRSWYTIEIQGHIDRHWSAWLGDLSIQHAAAGRAVLVGPIVDQAALNGLLNKIYDLGLPLISVTRAEPGDEALCTRLYNHFHNTRAERSSLLD